VNVSIFTPTHDTTYLKELYQSIKDQPFSEWVIVYNGDARPLEFNDPRVQSFTYDSNYVGALKRYACAQCNGDILLEVDHDDLLMEGAVAKVIEAFQDPSIGFVYSDNAHFEPCYVSAQPYNTLYGWETYTINYQGHDLLVHKTEPPIPSSMSKIWYAPDHLRAWRKDVYWQAGGHSAAMRVLDDQDLIARTFCITEFKHIPECLYLYRIMGKNTWIQYNEEIQNNVYRLYDQYIESMAMAWAKRQGLYCLDLGGRLGSPQETPYGKYTTVDLQDADIIANLRETWPFPDNSVGVLRAFDVFEHLPDPIHTMKEAYRVLAPNAYLLLQVPSTDGRGAFQDPTHVSFWNENSLLYYTNTNWAKYIDTPVRFMSDRCYTTAMDGRNVCWVKANLVALKGKRPLGLVEI